MSKSFCFSVRAFQFDEFSANELVDECRRHSDLDALRRDLLEYSKLLDNELIGLVNEDYTDFVRLSTTLAGIEKILEKIRAPLLESRAEVASLHQAVKKESNALEEKLQQLSKLESLQSTLQLLLDISQVSKKIEELLGIDPKTLHEREAAEPQSERDLRYYEQTANLMERVANDFNQLKFYLGKASGYPIARSTAPRIARIEAVLSKRLEALFGAGIRYQQPSIITSSLRTFAAIDKVRYSRDARVHCA
jgi:hypothetical protein